MANSDADVVVRFNGRDVVKGFDKIDKKIDKTIKKLVSMNKEDASKQQATGIRELSEMYEMMGGDIGKVRNELTQMNMGQKEVERVGKKGFAMVEKEIGNAKREAKELNKEFDRLQKNKGISGLGRNILASNAKVRKFVNDIRFGVAEIINQVSQAITHVYQLGIAYTNTAEAFGEFVERASDRTPEEALMALRRQTAGLVTDVDLLRSANVASLFGIDDRQFETITKYATLYARLSGNTENVGDFIERISLAISRASSRRLDDFGIWLTRTGDLSDPEKWRTAAIDEMALRINDLGSELEFAQDEIALMGVEFDGFMAAIGQAVKRDLDPVIKSLTRFFKWMGEWQKSANTFNELTLTAKYEPMSRADRNKMLADLSPKHTIEEFEEVRNTILRDQLNESKADFAKIELVLFRIKKLGTTDTDDASRRELRVINNEIRKADLGIEGMGDTLKDISDDALEQFYQQWRKSGLEVEAMEQKIRGLTPDHVKAFNPKDVVDPSDYLSAIKKLREDNLKAVREMEEEDVILKSVKDLVGSENFNIFKDEILLELAPKLQLDKDQIGKIDWEQVVTLMSLRPDDFAKEVQRLWSPVWKDFVSDMTKNFIDQSKTLSEGDLRDELDKMKKESEDKFIDDIKKEFDENIARAESFADTMNSVGDALAHVNPELGSFVSSIGNVYSGFVKMRNSIDLADSVAGVTSLFGAIVTGASLLNSVFNDTESALEKVRKEVERLNRESKRFSGDRRSAELFKAFDQEELAKEFDKQFSGLSHLLKLTIGRYSMGTEAEKPFVDSINRLRKGYTLYSDDVTDIIERNSDWLTDSQMASLKKYTSLLENIEQQKTELEIDFRNEEAQLILDNLELNHRKIEAQINAQAEAEKNFFQRWLEQRQELEAHRLRIQFADQFTAARGSAGLTGVVESNLQRELSALRRSQTTEEAEGLTDIAVKREEALFAAEQQRDVMIEAVETAINKLDVSFEEALYEGFKNLLPEGAIEGMIPKQVTPIQLAEAINDAYTKYSTELKKNWEASLEFEAKVNLALTGANVTLPTDTTIGITGEPSIDLTGKILRIVTGEGDVITFDPSTNKFKVVTAEGDVLTMDLTDKTFKFKTPDGDLLKVDISEKTFDFTTPEGDVLLIDLSEKTFDFTTPEGDVLLIDLSEKTFDFTTPEGDVLLIDLSEKTFDFTTPEGDVLLIDLSEKTFDFTTPEGDVLLIDLSEKTFDYTLPEGDVLNVDLSDKTFTFTPPEGAGSGVVTGGLTEPTTITLAEGAVSVENKVTANFDPDGSLLTAIGGIKTSLSEGGHTSVQLRNIKSSLDGSLLTAIVGIKTSLDGSLLTVIGGIKSSLDGSLLTTIGGIKTSLSEGGHTSVQLRNIETSLSSIFPDSVFKHGGKGIAQIMSELYSLFTNTESGNLLVDIRDSIEDIEIASPVALSNKQPSGSQGSNPTDPTDDNVLYDVFIENGAIYQGGVIVGYVSPTPN